MSRTLMRHLFLLGGSPPFGKMLAYKFAKLAGNANGKVGILFIERDGWEDYMQKYTRVLQDNGVEDFVFLPLTYRPYARSQSGSLIVTAVG